MPDQVRHDEHSSPGTPYSGRIGRLGYACTDVALCACNDDSVSSAAAIASHPEQRGISDPLKYS
jgi:hypothetical protein